MISQFLIISRKRLELDLEHCLGNFEFTVVPPSLLTSDGKPLVCTDKWKVLHNTEELGAAQIRKGVENCLAEMNVLAIDGLAVLNQMHRHRDMETCKVSFTDTSSPKSATQCKNMN